MKKLYIVGMGVGNENFLTNRANQIINISDKVLNSRTMSIKDLLDELKNPLDGTTTVLVSGDSCFFSIAKTIVKHFSDLYEIELENGISSVQYLSAKINKSYDDAKIISLHGRINSIIPYVSYNKKIFILTGGTKKAHHICKELCEHGLHYVKVTVGEKLSFNDERIITSTAEILCKKTFDDLSVMYIENPSFKNPHLPLKDSDFIRGDVPMTKEEVRHIAIQKLEINQTDIVYDIGAGTGSVTIEMARRAFEGFVYAIEMEEEACSLVKQNIQKHGAFNIKVIRAKAPDGLEGLPTPNKVFIGGTSGNMDSVISHLVEKTTQLTIVTTAITLQSLNEVINLYKINNLFTADIICVNIAKSKKVGIYDMMIAQNPIYIITGTSA